MTSVFRGVEAASESEFGVAGAIVSGPCVFVCFTGNNIGKIDRKTSHIISKYSQIIHIFANNVP